MRTLNDPNRLANTQWMPKFDSIYYRWHEKTRRVDIRVHLAHWPATRSDATLIANSFSAYWISDSLCRDYKWNEIRESQLKFFCGRVLFVKRNDFKIGIRISKFHISQVS